jgi:hypothetical protein
LEKRSEETNTTTVDPPHAVEELKTSPRDRQKAIRRSYNQRVSSSCNLIRGVGRIVLLDSAIDTIASLYLLFTLLISARNATSKPYGATKPKEQISPNFGGGPVEYALFGPKTASCIELQTAAFWTVQYLIKQL